MVDIDEHRTTMVIAKVFLIGVYLGIGCNFFLVRATTRKPGTCAAKGDLVFVIDSSASVGGHNFDKVKGDFLMDVVREFEIGPDAVRIGVIVFSDHAEIEIQLGEINSKWPLVGAIEKISYTPGSTNTAQALQVLRERVFNTSGDRPDVINIAVVLTDGRSNNETLTRVQAALAKSTVVDHILAVGVGNISTLPMNELFRIASSHDDILRTENFDTLYNLTRQISGKLCGVAKKANPIITVSPNTTDERTDGSIASSISPTTGMKKTTTATQIPRKTTKALVASTSAKLLTTSQKVQETSVNNDPTTTFWTNLTGVITTLPGKSKNEDITPGKLGDMEIGIIVGTVCAVFLTLFLILVCVAWGKKRKRKVTTHRKNEAENQLEMKEAWIENNRN